MAPGAGSVNNYWAEAFPDFSPGDGALVDDDSLASLTYLETDQAITAAGAINPLAKYVDITGPASSTYAVTLEAPSVAGRVMVIEMTGTTSTNAVTLALTNVVGGSDVASASFNAAGETLVLISASDKWVVLAEVGVTLTGP